MSKSRSVPEIEGEVAGAGAQVATAEGVTPTPNSGNVAQTRTDTTCHHAGATHPIILTSTKESQDSVVWGLVAFETFAKRQNRSVPPALRESLKEHVLTCDLRGLHLGDVFHLISRKRKDSSQTIRIFDFDVSTDDTVLMRSIKAWSTDRCTLNVKTGAMTKILGSWGGPMERHSTVDDIPEVADARSLLMEHWFNPQRWLKEGRLVIVRPGDLDSTKPPTHGVSKNSVALCQSAAAFLAKGFTLLLVKGDLIGIPVPWDRQGPMLVAGLMFKEGKPQMSDRSRHDEQAETRQARGRQVESRPDELAFIIAERAQRKWVFSGIKKPETAEKNGCQFLKEMYIWQEHDVYSYVAGKWR